MDINQYIRRCHKFPTVDGYMDSSEFWAEFNQDNEDDSITFQLNVRNVKVISQGEFNDWLDSNDDFDEDSLELAQNAAMHSPQGTKGMAQGERFDSYWEYAYFLWMREVKGEMCERNYEEYVPYIDELGKERKFYPDFKICGGYAEVKGILRPSDEQKMEQHPEIPFIFGDEIKAIMKELSKVHPNWRNEYEVLV